MNVNHDYFYTKESLILVTRAASFRHESVILTNCLKILDIYF